jgi:DNA (cytosine-5)-methyltransferase 1
MRFIDLFCGIGGFHQAMKRLGGTCVLACDIDASCRESYFQNYGILPKEDVTKLLLSEIPDHDLITFGAPCQAYSQAGQKKAMSDPRGRLVDFVFKIAKFKRTKYLVMENVKHIKKVSNGKVFEYVMNQLDEIGYNVQVIELSPHQLGIPQQRERVIFVAVRKDLPFPNIDLNLENPEMVSIFEEADPKYRISPEIEAVLSAWDEMVQVFEVGESLSPTILCQDFYNIFSDSEFEHLPEWRRDYIIKNRRIYEKYKEHWDPWFERHEKLLSKREVYSKLEWQCGKKVETYNEDGTSSIRCGLFSEDQLCLG